MRWGRVPLGVGCRGAWKWSEEGDEEEEKEGRDNAVGKRRLKLQRGTDAVVRRRLKLHATLVRWLSVARSHLGAACGWIEGDEEEEEEGEGDEGGCGW